MGELNAGGRTPRGGLSSRQDAYESDAYELFHGFRL